MSAVPISFNANSQGATPRRWMVLAVLVCLQFMLILDASVVNVRATR